MWYKIRGQVTNGPTSPFTDDLLYDQDIFVILDVPANAGGVTVSYFEWVRKGGCMDPIRYTDKM
jgi:glutamate dehydrogenase (NAD(P)+)